ncbi:uncharacterized protein B0P05DRAFT_582910 [Gilbertella persicaria]|uniref:uncharacterized protein n=1 Tax=Gilbertella persicaria TaxID=101096 RepID=UPI002220EB61|nr:uncharacterized protein B0P05DRAFT_582910 [Gilbertella persicaria]KAI8097925.1 hypothetical protein B0P05DRAFT_582910 [Gilbertella persicaria]
MTHFAKPGYSLANYDPFPFTNANLTDLSQGSNLIQPIDHDMAKENINIKKPQSPAERRAEHNAIERARRENLNAKFQSLAQALPNLMNYRRPSKSQIVEKALDWVKQSISREDKYRYQILHLQRENKKLLVQLLQQQQENAQVSVPAVYSEPGTNYDWHTPHLLTVTPKTTPYTSVEDLSKQDYLSSRSDDEDNTSSSNEDDIEYQLSPSYFDDKQHGNQCLLQHNDFMPNNLYYNINLH